MIYRCVQEMVAPYVLNLAGEALLSSVGEAEI